nr:hypothetical protein [Tanacetum cinerariifolium]
MLEKSMYDSWVSHICLFIKGKKHGRMMLDSIDHDPLVYPTVEENRETRLKKYSKLTEAQQLQDDCDVQATNIILHGLPPDVKEYVSARRNSIECINKAMAFLSAIVSRGIATTSKGNIAAGQPRVVKCYNFQGERHMARQCTQLKRPRNAAWFKVKLMLAKAQEVGQTLDEKHLAFLVDPDCNDLSSAKEILMANLSSCSLELLSESLKPGKHRNTLSQMEFMRRKIKRGKEEFAPCARRITKECKAMLRNKFDQINLFNSTLSSNKFKDYTCFYCTGRGHVAKICPTKLNDEELYAQAGSVTFRHGDEATRARIRKNKEAVECFKCQGSGHFANACPQDDTKTMQKQEKETTATIPSLPEPKVSIKYPEFIHFRTRGIIDGTDKGSWDDF